MPRATTSLPTPVSPQINTVTSARAACSITPRISRIGVLIHRSSSARRRSPFSATGGAPACARERFFARARDDGKVAPVLELADDATTLIRIAFDDEDLPVIDRQREGRCGLEARHFHRPSFAAQTSQEACRICTRDVSRLARE